MRIGVTSVVLISCLLFGCAQRLNRIAPFSSEESSVVEAATLKVLHNRHPTNSVAILLNTTSISTAVLGYEGYEALGDDLRAYAKLHRYKTESWLNECVDDFIRKNEQAWPINLQADAQCHLLIMSAEKVREEFSSPLPENSSQFWDSLRGAGFEAIVKASRVGFSVDGKYALLWLDIMSGVGSGGARFWFLKKSEDRWHIQDDCEIGIHIVY